MRKSDSRVASRGDQHRNASFTAQATVSPDGRGEVRMSLNPVFNNFVSKMNIRPVVSVTSGRSEALTGR